MPRLGFLLLLVAPLAVAGCRRTGDAPRASDATFIAAMVELRKLPPGSDSAARAAVLRRRGVTPATLERTARDLARDPVRAGKVWEAIERPEPDRPGPTPPPGRRPVPALK